MCVCVKSDVLDTKATPDQASSIVKYIAYRLIGLVGPVFANGPETKFQSQVASHQKL